jgi:hypothetical protein
MAFADPQSVTLNAVANSLPRVSVDLNSSIYRKDDGNVQLDISDIYGKRARRSVRLTHRKVAVDPLVPANSTPYSMSAYLVVDVPLVGYSIAEQKYNVDGLVGWLISANITKLLGGEN